METSHTKKLEEIFLQLQLEKEVYLTKLEKVGFDPETDKLLKEVLVKINENKEERILANRSGSTPLVT